MPVPALDMLAVSIWQPWASLIAIGVKRFETRSWPTRYRGPLLIHGSKRWDDEQSEIHANAVISIDYACIVTREVLDAFEKKPPLGAYLALVDLVECWPTFSPEDDSGRISELEREFGDWSHGRYAWQLENVIRFPHPIPGRGQQGLYVPGPDVLDRVREEVARASARPRNGTDLRVWLDVVQDDRCVKPCDGWAAVIDVLRGQPDGVYEIRAADGSLAAWATADGAGTGTSGEGQNMEARLYELCKVCESAGRLAGQLGAAAQAALHRRRARRGYARTAAASGSSRPVAPSRTWSGSSPIGPHRRRGIRPGDSE